RRGCRQGGLHGRDVQRDGSRDDEPAALRVRPGAALQPRQGLPDAASVRRPAGQELRAPPRRARRADRSRMIELEPSQADECGEILARAARERQRVAFVGGGTALEVGNPGPEPDLLLSTRRLDRVVEYAPED